MRLVICCDGTWDDKDGNIAGGGSPSNVFRMSEAVTDFDPQARRQICQYFDGVGATGNALDRLLGGAFGDGLDDRILEAYRFLMDHYHDGDEIYLFGFSRGAYTVRSLAGLIRNSGLLYPKYADQVDAAYKIYRNREPGAYPDGDAATVFRKSYSREPRIKFIGVWDTVGALGVPLSLFGLLNHQYQFHDVALSRFVDNAFQALAIDERREPFKPAVWAQQSEAIIQGQTLEQVWFSGVHTDIGGGATQNYLSSLSFLWMAQRAQRCGLELDSAYIGNAANFTLNPAEPLRGVIGESCTGFYEILLPYNRPIGQGGQIVQGGTPVDRYERHPANAANAESNEFVSACALSRFQRASSDQGYHYRSFDPDLPSELAKYLAGGGAQITPDCP